MVHCTLHLIGKQNISTQIHIFWAQKERQIQCDHKFVVTLKFSQQGLFFKNFFMFSRESSAIVFKRSKISRSLFYGKPLVFSSILFCVCGHCWRGPSRAQQHTFYHMSCCCVVVVRCCCMFCQIISRSISRTKNIFKGSIECCHNL